MSQFLAGPQAVEELAVVLAIVDFRRPNVTRLPSLSYLAFVAGLDEPEFKEALTRLQQKGLIRVQGTLEGLDVRLDGLLDEILARSAKRERVEGGSRVTLTQGRALRQHGRWTRPTLPGPESAPPFRKALLGLEQGAAATDRRSGERS